jgi:hypothetical protein
MYTSDVLHDSLVLERQVLEELSKRVKAVVDIIIIGITSYKLEKLINLNVTIMAVIIQKHSKLKILLTD